MTAGGVCSHRLFVNRTGCSYHAWDILDAHACCSMMRCSIYRYRTLLYDTSTININSVYCTPQLQQATKTVNTITVLLCGIIVLCCHMCPVCMCCAGQAPAYSSPQACGLAGVIMRLFTHRWCCGVVVVGLRTNHTLSHDT